MVHASAERQVTGEAIYIDDMPRLSGELMGALVVSQRPHAKIKSINAEKALQVSPATRKPTRLLVFIIYLQVPGVVGFFSHKDVPGDKLIGDIVHDEEVFASSTVYSVGQPIGEFLWDARVGVLDINCP